MLAKLASGIPVDGMEALMPVLGAAELTPLTDASAGRHAAAGVRPGEGPHPRRRPDQDRPEFLEASWSTAALGSAEESIAPIDVTSLGASGFLDLDDVRAAAVAAGHPWWTLSQLADPDAERLDMRAAPSARGHQHSVEEIFAMLRAHVRTGGTAAIVAPGTGTAHRVVEQLREADVAARLPRPG